MIGPKNNPPSDNQLWQLDYQPDGTFLIISKLHGKALDCGGQTEGTKLIVWDRHGGNNQRWRMEGNHITSVSGLVMDVEHGHKEHGTHVILWNRNSTRSDNQLFELEQAVSPCNHHLRLRFYLGARRGWKCCAILSYMYVVMLSRTQTQYR